MEAEPAPSSCPRARASTPAKAVTGMRLRIGVAVSQDGAHWSRLEGEHPSGRVPRRRRGGRLRRRRSSAGRRSCRCPSRTSSGCTTTRSTARAAGTRSAWPRARTGSSSRSSAAAAAAARRARRRSAARRPSSRRAACRARSTSAASLAGTCCRPTRPAAAARRGGMFYEGSARNTHAVGLRDLGRRAHVGARERRAARLRAQRRRGRVGRARGGLAARRARRPRRRRAAAHVLRRQRQRRSSAGAIGLAISDDEGLSWRRVKTGMSAQRGATRPHGAARRRHPRLARVYLLNPQEAGKFRGARRSGPLQLHGDLLGGEIPGVAARLAL